MAVFLPHGVLILAFWHLVTPLQWGDSRAAGTEASFESLRVIDPDGGLRLLLSLLLLLRRSWRHNFLLLLFFLLISVVISSPSIRKLLTSQHGRLLRRNEELVRTGHLIF